MRRNDTACASRRIAPTGATGRVTRTGAHFEAHLFEGLALMAAFGCNRSGASFKVGLKRCRLRAVGECTRDVRARDTRLWGATAGQVPSP